MKTKINVLIILISFFCLSFSVKAQEPASPANIEDNQMKQLLEKVMATGEAGNSEVTLIATINIYNAQIVSQEDNRIKLIFDLSNREKIQPDVKYAVQLIKQDGKKQTIADEKVYPETINLNENQTIKKEIEYIAPDYLNGEFKLWIIAKNQNGLSLSAIPVGDINLTGTKEYLDISNCNLKVEGDNRSYTQNQGVDIKPEEKLIATCDIQSNFQQEQIFIPTFETHFRTTFGQIVKDNREKESNGLIGPMEKKSVYFILPKATEPQAYDVILELKNQNNQSISNKVNFHYVLAGVSATIQNLTLDNDYYQKNEIAKASFFWSGSAANFPQSRLNQFEQSKLFLNIEIENCSEIKKQELSLEESLISLDIPIIKECIDPKVIIGILDENSKVLDSKIFSIKSQDTSQNKKAEITQNQTKTIAYGIFFVIILLAISLLVFLIKRKRSGTIAIFFLVIFSSLTMFVRESKADTFVGNLPADQCSGRASRGTIVFTVSLNKSSYAFGETIIQTASAAFPTCDNAVANVSMSSENSIPGSWTPLLIGEENLFGGQNISKTAYFKAEAQPGNYAFATYGALWGYSLNCDKSNPDHETRVDANFTNGHPLIYNGLGYSVVNTPPIGHHESLSCNNGTITANGWAFDPDASGTSISMHFYEGSSYLGQCVTNMSRPDVNSVRGISGNHGFSCSFSGMSTGNHSVTSYAIDTSGGYNPVISNSPKSATCCSPDCSNVTNVCAGTTYSDGCGGYCTGTKSASRVCTNNTGVPCVSTPNTKICTCIGSSGSCTQDCPATPPTGPCNSNKWREVAP